MYCKQCGAFCPDNVSYCAVCGNRLTEPGPQIPFVLPAPNPEVKPERMTTQVLFCVIVVAAIAVIACIAIINANNGQNETFEEHPEDEIYYIRIVKGSHISYCTESGYHHKGEVTVMALTETNYLFKGWYDSSGKLLSSNSIYRFEAKDITLYPRAELSKIVLVREPVKLLMYKGLGIESVEGEGTYTAGQNVTLKAEMVDGYGFGGWYKMDETTPFSTKETCTFNITESTVVYALSDAQAYKGDKLLAVSPTKNFDKGDRLWVVTDAWTGNFVSIVKSNNLSIRVGPGVYLIGVYGTINGNDEIETFTKTVTGDFERTCRWSYKGNDYGVVMTYDFSYVQKLHSKIGRAPVFDITKKSFVDYNDYLIQSLAEFMHKETMYLSDEDKVGVVLSFVQQCIQYEYDDDYCKKAEYFKYPLETLYDMRGDCEDSSILFAAIVKAMGYDVVLCEYTDLKLYRDKGHMAVAVALENCYGMYYEYGGKKYFYCETTNTGWQIGKMPDDYDEARLIPI